MQVTVEKQQPTFPDNDAVREAILRDKPKNLALQRLQSRILKDSEASEVISSYDRMHHRHNRS